MNMRCNALHPGTLDWQNVRHDPHCHCRQQFDRSSIQGLWTSARAWENAAIVIHHCTEQVFTLESEALCTETSGKVGAVLLAEAVTCLACKEDVMYGVIQGPPLRHFSQCQKQECWGEDAAQTTRGTPLCGCKTTTEPHSFLFLILWNSGKMIQSTKRHRHIHIPIACSSIQDQHRGLFCGSSETTSGACCPLNGSPLVSFSSCYHYITINYCFILSFHIVRLNSELRIKCLATAEHPFHRHEPA